MNVDLTITVSDFLKQHPAAIDLFLRKKLLCLGCPVQACHTLEDVALIHGFRKTDLRKMLDEAIRQSRG